MSARMDQTNGRTAPRIALYSHDTQGLGHVRRNILISRALCQGRTAPVILLLSGLREATAFPMPPGVDCVTLPSFGKGVDGEYFPRSLDVPMRDLIDVRGRAITAVLRSFDPDVLIVDKAPRGVFDELMSSLRLLRQRGTRIVLGLREILDDPPAIRREWAVGRYEPVIRSYYDRIWVYGDRRVYDTAGEYGFSPEVAEKVRFSGYLNPLDAPVSVAPADEGWIDWTRSGRGPLSLCVVGGGRDGLPLAEAFLRAEHPGDGLLVTGPLMPDDGRAMLRALVADKPHLRVLEFVTDPCPLLARADRVIAMGGYNTVCEILASGKRALVVPRVRPRTEQLIRADRLAALGLLDLLHPDDLTPGALSAWMAAPNGAVRRADRIVDFKGVQRLPALLEEALAVDRRREDAAHAVR